MRDFIILMGIPRSGKSTWGDAWANEDKMNRIKICIPELNNTNGDNIPEQLILSENKLLKFAIETNRNIAIDGINLEPGRVELFENYLKEAGLSDLYKISIKLFSTPVEECIARDRILRYPLGEKEIRRIFRRYKDRITFLLNSEIVAREVKPNPLLPDCIIVDIDGTLCLNVTGRPFYNAGDSVLQDKPVIPVCKIIRSFISTNVCEVIFITGRDNSMAKATEEYIEQHLGIVNPKIFYRDLTDYRKSYQTKLEVYQKYILGKYNVVFVLEDNNSVVKMFREQGLTVLQPNASDY